MIAVPETLLAADRLPNDVDDRGGSLRVPESVKFSHQRAWEARFDDLYRATRPP